MNEPGDTSPLGQYDRQAHLNWYEKTYPHLPEWPPYPRTNLEAAEAITQYTGKQAELDADEHPADGDTGEDLAVSIRRLIDAGYEVSFRQPLAGAYYAEVTNDSGSRWKCLGDTPAEALRSNWPLGYRHGQGGCGHCGGLGCEVDGCEVCKPYTSEPGNGVCGVCGDGYPVADEDELLGDDTDDEEPDEYEDAVGPDTPCHASSQLGTVCAEVGVHMRHDDHRGTTWEAM